MFGPYFYAKRHIQRVPSSRLDCNPSALRFSCVRWIANVGICKLGHFMTNKHKTYDKKRGPAVIQIKLKPEEDQQPWFKMKQHLIEKYGEIKSGIRKLIEEDMK